MFFFYSVKEEALSMANEVLRYMPNLKTEKRISWFGGAREEFRQLCELLKRNAIPTKQLFMGCRFMLIQIELKVQKIR